MDTEAFFRFADERYQIYLRRKNGGRWPWTEDPILQRYRFCNVFREHDRTTEWLRRNIREPYRHTPGVLFAVVMFRWFNRVETAQRLGVSRHFNFNAHRTRNLLEGESPVIGAGYIIRTPPGMSKIDGILDCLERVLGADPARYANELIREQGERPLQDTWRWLQQFPCMGPFMAYEVVTDLRHTNLHCHAPDIMTWANPGPGCARGVSRLLFDGDPGKVDRNKAVDRATMMRVMRELTLAANSRKAGWSAHYPRWEMREAEHVLCEFDKYERARRGEGAPKQRYRQR